MLLDQLCSSSAGPAATSTRISPLAAAFDGRSWKTSNRGPC
jgi:hypothetical protein